MEMKDIFIDYIMKLLAKFISGLVTLKSCCLHIQYIKM